MQKRPFLTNARRVVEMSFSVPECTASSLFPRSCRRVLSTGFSVFLCTRVVFAYYSSARRGRCRSGCGIGTHS